MLVVIVVAVYVYGREWGCPVIPVFLATALNADRSPSLAFQHSPCVILRHYIKYYIFHTAPALYCDITLNIIFSTQPLCYIVTLHYLLSRHKTKDELQFGNLRLKHIFHLFICASHKLQFWQCTEKIEEVCTKRLPNQLSTGLRRLQSSRPTAPTACDEKLISIHKC